MDTTQHEDSETLRGDLLRGARRIAAHISILIDEPVEESKVYYWAKTKKWPIGKLGAELFASVKKLNRHAQKITSV
jgi:hypothetical protein